MKVDIKVLSEAQVNELAQLVSLFEDVFEMENVVLPPRQHLEALLADKNFIAVTATSDGKVIGGLTAYILQQYYSVRPLAYIYDLAIAVQYQRMGVGGDLIYFFNEYCRQQGIEETFVQADKIDDYAVNFYRKTSPYMEKQVIHFSYRLKP